MSNRQINFWCSEPDCERPAFAKQLCAMHYRRQQRAGYGTCTVEGCTRTIQDSGLCPMHKRRLRIHGDLGPAGPKGHKPRKIVTKRNGGNPYALVAVPEGYPGRDQKGYILEHRYVMAEYIGRPLTRNETVHHRNGNTLDNRLENLELWSENHRPGQRVEDLVAWADEIIDLYGAKFGSRHG